MDYDSSQNVRKSSANVVVFKKIVERTFSLWVEKTPCLRI